MSVERVEYPEHWLTIEWTDSDHCLDFVAKEWFGVAGPDYTRPCYMLPCESGPIEPTEDFAHGERFIEGAIKWDGCSHITFGDENGYLHLCGRAMLDKVGLVLQMAWERAARLPTWAADLADRRVLPADAPKRTET